MDMEEVEGGLLTTKGPMVVAAGAHMAVGRLLLTAEGAVEEIDMEDHPQADGIAEAAGLIMIGSDIDPAVAVQSEDTVAGVTKEIKNVM